ncbi:MAG: YHYH domain-containing protein [SAR324 cluster bacterium]|nr:YHYH domain-containing protein [SAR324 cluster bacterium]
MKPHTANSARIPHALAVRSASLGKASLGGALLGGAVLAALLLTLRPPGLHAHPGSLDEYGGHFNDKLGNYHYHRPLATMAKRKKEFLTWIDYRRTGEIRGKVAKLERADALWLRLEYRPAYQDLARVLTAGNRKSKEMWVKIYFQHVSPEASVNRGRKYNAWFRKKVVYELGRKLIGKDVVVQFRIVQDGKRMYGMVFKGGENINLWLVLNGWSYYLLTQGENPFGKEFIKAEQLARKQKAGLWSR